MEIDDACPSSDHDESEPLTCLRPSYAPFVGHETTVLMPQAALTDLAPGSSDPLASTCIVPPADDDSPGPLVSSFDEDDLVLGATFSCADMVASPVAQREPWFATLASEGNAPKGTSSTNDAEDSLVPVEATASEGQCTPRKPRVARPATILAAAACMALGAAAELIRVGLPRTAGAQTLAALMFEQPALPAATGGSQPSSAPSSASSTPSAAVIDLDSPSPLASAAPEPKPDEGARLAGYQAYLVIASSVEADVFVHGAKIGRTNQRAIVTCTQKQVRLRDARTQRWLSSGRLVDIPCRATTTISVEPDAR
jgi:hypothetical protein